MNNYRNVKQITPEHWTEVKNKYNYKSNIDKLLDMSVERNNNTLYKTKFCNKKKCNKDCNFAHSIDEINCIPCHYDDTCRQVYVKDDKVYNKSSLHICKYKHSLESKIEFLNRSGIIKKENIHINTTKDKLYEDIKRVVDKGILSFSVNIML